MGHTIAWNADGVTIDDRYIALVNLDKPLGTKERPCTRRDVVEYYIAVGDYILPYVRCRRLTGVRHPDGLHGAGFYMKTAPKKRPDWVETVPAPHGETDGSYVCLNNLATLVWLASSDVIELHVPHTTVDRPDTVSGIILDLDPGAGRDLSDAARVAQMLRETFLQERVVRYKTSGKQGLHMYLPLEEPISNEDAQNQARDIATAASQKWSNLVVDTPGKTKRGGKVLIDWQQNARHRTTAAPYTLRGGGGVSTPVHEHELRDIEAGMFHVKPRDIPGRLVAHGDLYKV